MRSKNWSCKLSWPLVRKDVTRFWPVWGSYLAIWFMILPVPLLTDFDALAGSADTAQDIHRLVVNMGSEPAMMLSLAYGLVCSFAVWSYLFQGRSASLFHALPVTRETLFLSHWTAGLGFLLVPNALIAVITYLCQVSVGYFDPTVILSWLVVVSLQCLLFYSIGTLCAMFTGSLPAMPVLYGLVNFAAVVIETMINTFATMLYFGVTSLDLRFHFLSPFIKILDQRTYISGNITAYSSDAYTLVESIRQFNPEYVTMLCIYGIAALVLSFCALLLYRRRSTESAGDVIAVSWLKPIAKYVFSFGCALVLGYVFLLVFFPSAEAALPLFLCVAAGGAVGYIAAAMLLKKSFRVFTLRQMAGLLCLTVALGGWVMAMEADLLGVESRVPRAGEVVSASISSEYALELTQPQEIDLVLDLHRTILEHQREIERGSIPGDPMDGSVYVRINYTLDDGETLRRSYYLPYSEAAPADPSGPVGKLRILMSDPIRLAGDLLPPEDAVIESLNLYLDALRPQASSDRDFLYDSCYVDTDDIPVLWAALRSDILMGHLGGWNRDLSDAKSLCWLEFNYQAPDAAGQMSSYWKSVHLYSIDKAPATRQALYALGYLTEVPDA